jgi:hypothetical protein
MKQYPTVMIYGTEVDYDVAVNLMDDDIREELHSKLTPCTEQEFMDAYVKAHYEKYDEYFIVN